MNTLGAVVTTGLLSTVALCAPSHRAQNGNRDDDTSRFEVWIADQSDARPGFGGQILIFEGDS